MAKMSEFNSLLTPEGEEIFAALRAHCHHKLKMEDVDDFELAMLANSFYLYADNARYCNENGVKITFQTEKGEYSQICPEYTVMKNEYQNIIKHSSKFGLNPGDRAKFFKGLLDSKEKKGFNLKSPVMKAS